MNELLHLGKHASSGMECKWREDRIIYISLYIYIHISHMYKYKSMCYIYNTGVYTHRLLFLTTVAGFLIIRRFTLFCAGSTDVSHLKSQNE